LASEELVMLEDSEDSEGSEAPERGEEPGEPEEPELPEELSEEILEDLPEAARDTASILAIIDSALRLSSSSTTFIVPRMSTDPLPWTKAKTHGPA